MPVIPQIYPGPRVDDRPTWFARGKDIPTGWERRRDTRDDWSPTTATTYSIPGAWYQVRPLQLDDPVTLAYGADDVSRIVLWKEMKDRPDLDQWEWLTGDGRWTKLPTQGAVTNDVWPLRVRRRQPVEVEVPTEIRLRQEIHKAGLSSTAVDVVISVLQREGLLE